jgi:Asp-tRNA(Asn)/Glu-tRNA(Gln) amidotransferase A subunit family amidase
LNQAFKAKWDQAETDAATVAAAGAWISDRKYFGKSDVSARTKAIITLGQFQYTANYQKALERQAKWQHALGQVFEKVDFIALPNSSGSCRQKFHSSAAGPFLKLRCWACGTPRL